MPQVAQALILAGEQAQRAYELGLSGRFDSCITSNYPEVYARLREECRRGDRFLEWGSGLGVITALAASLGAEAYGIEIEPELVRLSEGLVERHDVPATFACGSFFPDGFGEDPELLHEDLMHDSVGADAYAELGLELTDFDLIYAFPWPGEEDLFLDLFQRGAAPGSRLLINYGSDGLRLERNTQLDEGPSR
jgi:hypothetical protein